MKNLIKIMLCGALVSLPIIFSKAVSLGVKNGIEISLTLAIPSLFCFMVICDILYKSGLINALIAPIRKILCKFYNLDKNSLGVVVLSQIGGFPVGAKLIADLVKSKKLDLKSAENMLCYCVNCGPAFLVSAVGVSLFGSIKLGLVIFACELFASCACGFIVRGCMKQQNLTMQEQSKKDYASIVVTSTASCVRAMAMICAFIILFCALTQVLENCGLYPLLQKIIKSEQGYNAVKIFISGILEVTNGCFVLSSASFYQKLILSVLFTSFGGICVHMQIMSIVAPCGIKLKKFYLMRIIYCAISTLSAFICTKFIDIPQTVFNSYSKITPQISTNSYISSFFLIFLSIGLLLSCKKSAKI